jgi:DNA-binding CsgD family transcriptional regulator
MLLGRRYEREVFDRLFEAVQRGESRVLVVRGEPGVGKSALLEYAAESAAGLRVARAAGRQSEMELAFAGLHQLFAPMLDRVDRLPAPQRVALGTALGLTSGPAPERFLLALAVLGVVSEIAEERPLLCLVDDAQWLDQESAQALELVARRLLADSVGLVFAVRQVPEAQPLAGLPELRLEGLSNGDARALLGSAISWPLDDRVRDRIIAETRGNPLALLELPRRLTPAEMAGGFGLLDPSALSRRIEDSFQRRLWELPTETQRLLLVAAAEPVGEAALVRRAAGRLGIGVEATDPAESDGLVQFGTRVTFRHPLVRSAIYRAATPEDRREAHRALAKMTDPKLDPDRRAWHLALAAAGPDEEVASELERSAGRAQSRGGLAAAAAFLERSAALTPDGARRAERALAAAGAHAQAGAFDPAVRCLDTAEVGPLEELESARADLLRGQIAFGSGHGREAPPLLLKAAKRLEPLDVRLARETYLEALSAAQYAARLVTNGGLRDVAEGALAAPPSSQPPGGPDLLLDGLALLVMEGPAAAAPILKRAVSAFVREDVSREEGVRWLWIVWPTAQILWDDAAWEALTTRGVQLVRDAGALGVLPVTLRQSAGLHLYEGDFAAAVSLCDEAASISEATGSSLSAYVPLMIAAFRGREAEAFALAEASMRDVLDRGEGVGLTLNPWAMAVLYNSLAHYQDALVSAQRACEDPDEQVFSLLATMELTEAAARSGVPEKAADALDRLTHSTRASGTDWGLGVEARASALLSDGEAAERLYREAIDRLGRTRIRLDLARAHLLYGEWLRRERRRVDAREHLRIAHEMFAAMGAEGFADRAAGELRATGETARKRAPETRSELTPQEAQVAELARDGLSNREIGARLFISPHTAAYHLRKVFAKLDIRSRRQLNQVLLDGRQAGPADQQS